MGSIRVPAALTEASPTARLVYLVLDGVPELTIAELVERTGCCTSAVKRALGDLRHGGFVERDAHPTDGRMVRYSTTGDKTHAHRE